MPRLFVFDFEGTIGDRRQDSEGGGNLWLYDLEAFERLVEGVLAKQHMVAIISDTSDSIAIYAALPASIRDRVILFGADESKHILEGYISGGAITDEAMLLALHNYHSIPLTNRKAWGDAVTKYCVDRIQNHLDMRTSLWSQRLDPDSYQYKTLTKFKEHLTSNDQLLELIKKDKLNECDNNRLYQLNFLRQFLLLTKGKDFSTEEVVLVDDEKDKRDLAQAAEFDVVVVNAVADKSGKNALVPVNLLHFQTVAMKAGIFSYRLDGQSSRSPAGSAAITQEEARADTPLVFRASRDESGSANRSCCGGCTIS